MRKNRTNLRTINLVAMSLAVVFFALVKPLRAAADDDDPPSRVARLSYAAGSLSFQPAGTDDWVDAVVNRPLTTGDKLWADDDGRAELHLGSASIRMFSHTGFSFLNLTDNTTQIQLTAGTLRIRVKRLEDDENFEVDTPNLAFSILRPGIYRIFVDEDGNSTVVKVRKGEGEVTGGGSAYTVHAREAATFSGTDELSADFNTPWEDEDDFEQWCDDRDRHEDLSASRRYVSDDVVGYEDLDDNGGWRPVPGYGTVWFPHTTIVGWAPYRYGHWTYIYPWGYTWIDDEPWGYAPFHYGRWVNVNGVWGWVPCPPRAPGVVYVRPVYAPALVAWVGGPHFSVGISVGGGGGGVGWFPLGPREVYVPSYPVSRTYITNVNVSNTTVNQTVINNYYNNTTVINKNTTIVNNNVQIHQTYVNQSVPGAVTATTSQAFTSAQPVSRNAIRVNDREMATAQASAFTPAVAPAKQAVLGAGASTSVRPPAAVQTRAVVAKVAPPPPPVSFARQQEAIQANGGRPLGISQARQIQPPAIQQAVHPVVKIAPPANPVVPPNVQNARPGPPQNVQGGRLNQQQNPGPNPPSQPSNANIAGQGQGNAGNRPGSNSSGQPGGNTSSGGNRSFNDRPPSARPSGGNVGNTTENTGGSNITPIDMKHQQQLEQLHNKQDQDRQKLEQQQQAERQRLTQQAADERRQAELNQKHQQELQAQEQQHAKQDQDRQKLEQQQQQAERQRLAQQAADERRQAELNQKHQQELQAQEQQHQAEQQRLQQKQNDERHTNQSSQPSRKPAKDDHGKDDHGKGGDHGHDR